MFGRTKEEVGRQHQGMDRPGVRQVPEGSGEQGKMEKTGCKRDPRGQGIDDDDDDNDDDDDSGKPSHTFVVDVFVAVSVTRFFFFFTVLGC